MKKLLVGILIGVSCISFDVMAKPAPSFSLMALDGKSYKLSEVIPKNEVTVVNFWATWCTSCVAEFPEIDKVAQELKSKKVSVMAINVEEPADKIVAALRGLKISFPILLDKEGAAKAQYQLVALPSTFIIDSQGVIQEQIVGGVTADTLKKKIKKVLNLPSK